MLNIGNVFMESLDYIMIVDKNMHIVYNTRYDEMLNDNSNEYQASSVIGKYFFDVYPYIPKKESSFVKCLTTQDIIVQKGQKFKDYRGRVYCTHNVTFPLLSKGELIGAVELSIDANDGDSSSKEANDRYFDDFVFKLKQQDDRITFESILTASKPMMESIEKAKLLARLSNPTLIYGETGTGKELFAQAMITYSKVPRSKVVIQNCAAVPPGLMESILFGTVKGSYTGAENRHGLFEEADGGILFLDELNSIPYNVQSKLLRVIQDGTFMPIGGSKEKHTNVKVIAAMNVDPVEAMENNQLRKDIFYRFSSGLITLYPLRERKEDIPLFINYYVQYFSKQYGKSPVNISGEVRDLFYAYPWEGNVRELKNVVESMIISLNNDDLLTVKHIPKYVLERMNEKSGIGQPPSRELNIRIDGALAYQEAMESVERQLFTDALERAKGNRSRAAEYVGLPRQTFNYRARKLGL